MGKVQYHLADAGRAWRRKGKAAHAAFFFARGQPAGVDFGRDDCVAAQQDRK
jgi:hypothetical protein